MQIGDKKFACDACVRGHRVSGCNHTDRPLQEIQKKGRPVSQCQHCRTMRKSRSTHVKCDCGEKVKGIAKHHYFNVNGVLVDIDDRDGVCACPTGGVCSCALKKEQLDAVCEFPTSSPSTSTSTDAPRKPKLQSTQSDGCLTKFANGHHKPVHRHHNNHATAPYHIPPHHGHSAGGVLPLHDFPTDGEFTLPEPLTQVPIIPSQVHPPLVLQDYHFLPRVKSEDNSPDLTSSTYSSGSERIIPSVLSRSVSDFNLPVGSRLPYELSLQTDIPRFATSEYTPADYYFSATGSDASNQNPAFYSPAGWGFEPPQYEVPPGLPALTQSQSGDDSEFGDTLQFRGNPSPIYGNTNPLDYLQDPISTGYESDEPRGISTQSSMVDMSQLAIHPSGELGTLGSFNRVSNLDLSSVDNNTIYQDPTLMEPTIDLYGEDKQFEFDQYAGSARNSTYIPDSEVFMMYRQTSPNGSLPPLGFESAS